MEKKVKKRIAIILSGSRSESFSVRYGGIQIAEINAAIELAKENIIHLFLNNGELQKNNIRILHQGNLSIHEFRSLPVRVSGITQSLEFSMAVRYELTRLCLGDKLDYIHFTSVFPAAVFMNNSFVSSTLFKFRPPKIIYTVHNSLYLTKNPEFMFKNYPEEWKFLNVQERLLLQFSDIVVVPSKYYINYLERNILKRKYTFIQNTVGDRCFFKIFHPRFNEREKRMVFIGRLSEEKNLINILRAFSVARGKYPLLRFFIVGEGDQKNELMRECKNLKLSFDDIDSKRRISKNSSVVFKGVLHGSEKWSFLSQCSFLCSPSYIEVSPLVAYECLAIGLPFIGSLSNGWHDFSGVKGLEFANPNKIDEISSAIVRMCDRTPEHLMQVSKLMRYYYDHNLSPKRIIKLRNNVIYT